MRHPLLPATTARPANALKLAVAVEPALTIDDICKVRRQSRRTGVRERSAGLWPDPDFHVGTGSRKSPRWWPRTIQTWLGAEVTRNERGVQ